MFLNELDRLKIRLNTLDDIVDEFILVEGTRNFKGEKKELHFNNNKDEFERYLDKINHVVIDSFPEKIVNSPWKMQAYSRNAIQRGLGTADPNDTILISDVDEIPNPVILYEIINTENINILIQDLFYYYYNYRIAGRKTAASVVSKYKNFSTPQEIRSLAPSSIKNWPLIPFSTVTRAHSKMLSFKNGRVISLVENGGWHFSYIGGTDKILDKLNSISDSRTESSKIRNEEYIKEKIENGEDIYERGRNFEKVPISKIQPDYIKDNLDIFESDILT